MGGGRQSGHIFAGLVYTPKCQRVVLREKYCQIMRNLAAGSGPALRQESERRIDLAPGIKPHFSSCYLFSRSSCYLLCLPEAGGLLQLLRPENGLQWARPI